MATESIFIPIKIETPEEIARFVKALEAADAVATERADTSGLFSMATKDELATMFRSA